MLVNLLSCFTLRARVRTLVTVALYMAGTSVVGAVQAQPVGIPMATALATLKASPGHWTTLKTWALPASG